MFRQIEQVSTKWVNEQIGILSDAQLLIADVDQVLGKVMQEFIGKLTLLNIETRNSICKDHVFHNWLNEIKIEIIKVYENKIQILNRERLNTIFDFLNLSISILTKTEFRFTIPPSSFSKVLFPATGFFFDFSPMNKLNEITSCYYFPTSSELEIRNVRYKLSSFQQFESIKIINTNFDFFLDPTGDKYTIDFDDNINLSEWIKILSEALAIIKTDESSYKLIRNFVSYIIPLKQKEIIKNLSFSVRNLPNVIFKSNEVIPYLVGETLVHEADHQFFYAIEKFETFWSSDVLLQKAIYFSPWRDDPRPLDGILRGLSSFARVSKYYSTVLTTFAFSEHQIESVGSMLLTRFMESEVALKTISESKQLSDFGIKYINEIQETLNEVTEFAKRHNEYERWRDNGKKVINTHKRKWELHNHQNG